MRSNITVAIVALIAGFAGGLMAPPIPAARAANPPAVVTATDFRLVDSAGHLIAELAPSSTPVWRAELHIAGYSGHFADLGATNLIFGSSRGGELGLGYVTKNGTPETTALFLYANGKPRMLLGLNADRSGSPYIRMFNEGGGVLWAAPEPR